jgi:low affinity Fe/Cu permease
MSARVPIRAAGGVMAHDRSTVVTRSVSRVTEWMGSFPAILISFGLIATWLIGAIFVRDHFQNDTYQLTINTVTSVVAFLMAFVIQATQNRDSRALQAKLDAQSHVLRAMAEKIGVDVDLDCLERLEGLEDAPASVIRAEQDEVRAALRKRTG